MTNQANNRSGFTIIEVVITIAIGAAVMALVLNAVAGARRSQRNNARTADVSQLASAINQYIGAYNEIPSNWGEISPLIDSFGHYDSSASSSIGCSIATRTTSSDCTATGTWDSTLLTCSITARTTSSDCTATGTWGTITTTKSVNPAKSLNGTDPTSGGVFISVSGGPTTPQDVANGIGAKGSTTGATEAADKVVVLQKTSCTASNQIEKGSIREMAILYRLEGQDTVFCIEV